MRAQLARMQEDLFKGVLRIAAGFEKAFDRYIDQVDRDLGRTTSPEAREQLKRECETGDYRVTVDNTQHLVMLESTHEFAHEFYRQDWTVIVSRDAGSFVTSDNPVGEVWPEEPGPRGVPLVGRTHYLALTPELCIEARLPHHRGGKKLRRKTLYPGDERAVTWLNMVLATNAHRYAYARDRHPLEELLQTLPPKLEPSIQP
jgi:hypothetical protein